MRRRTQCAAEQQEHGCRKDEADRCAQLREHAVPVLLARGRILGGQQDGPAPFAAQPKTLAEAAQRQQRRRQQSRGVVRGQQADGHGGNTHGQQGRNQRGLATHAIAVVPEHGRAHRSREEGQREGGQRLQGRRVLVRSGEKQLREHQHRGSGINVEIEELDRRADQAREQHPSR
jgi:hypothetical protein